MGDYKLTDVKLPTGRFEGRPEVYFRVVRPSKSSDVGQLHADVWFDKLLNIDYEGKRAFKTWTLLWGDSSNPGLQFFQFDEDLLGKYVVVVDSQGNKAFNSLINTRPAVNLNMNEGDSFLFDHLTLHQGISHRSVTRVSVEIDFCPKGYR